MAGKLDGKRVAIVATDGFEQDELTKPKAALEGEGATCEVVSPKKGTIRGWKGGDWADAEPVDVDVALADADASKYDALVLPGGVMNPDKLRGLPEMQKLVKGFFDAKKPIAAICHGPWSLVDAGVLRGRKVTSYSSIKSDLVNAGATWVDEEVVVDNGLVTSRKPDDIPAFNAKTIEEIAEGSHA